MYLISVVCFLCRFGIRPPMSLSKCKLRFFIFGQLNSKDYCLLEIYTILKPAGCAKFTAQ